MILLFALALIAVCKASVCVSIVLLSELVDEIEGPRRDVPEIESIVLELFGVLQAKGEESDYKMVSVVSSATFSADIPLASPGYHPIHQFADALAVSRLFLVASTEDPTLYLVEYCNHRNRVYDLFFNYRSLVMGSGDVREWSAPS